MNNRNELSDERNNLLKKLEQMLEGRMTFLGFVWLILLVIELINGLNAELIFTSIFISVLFIIDFLLKFILAPRS